MATMNIWFESELHYDPMIELKNLRQLGSVQVYLNKFEEILNRLSLLEEYAVSCFLTGLKDEI